MNYIILIGAGTMGRVHAQAYSNMKQAQVVGVVDVRPEKAQELADKLQTRAYATLEEAIKNESRADMVDICVPTDLHDSCVRTATDAGLHVICEKPLSGTYKEALELVQYCQDKGVRLFVGHVVRFFPEYARAKEQMEQGVIGKPAMARLSRCGSFPLGSQDWFEDDDRSGGVVLDLMIHDLDFLRWCFGEVESVFAKGRIGKDAGQLQYALVTLRFKNGVIAHVEGSWAHTSFTTKFELAGSKGIIDFSSAEKPVNLQQRTADRGHEPVKVAESPLTLTPYYYEIEHFLACLQSGSEPLVTARDACEAVRLARAAIESIRTGNRVTFEEQIAAGGNQP
jgi:UDP-N-acetylglucosamine 3-dehydrogenase